jgi:hypothetical protein
MMPLSYYAGIRSDSTLNSLIWSPNIILSFIVDTFLAVLHNSRNDDLIISKIDSLNICLPFPGSLVFLRSRDSSVGITTCYRLDNLRVGVRVPELSRIFSFPRRPDRLWGTLNFLSNFPEIKRPGTETDHSSPTSTENKKTWIYTSTPPYVFMA